jgi:RimJ/RimL family protein N-acetyltransferase
MLGSKIYFKRSKLPSKKKLEGKYVFLEPLKINKHSEDLFNNFLKDKKNLIWKYLPYGPFRTYESFKKWIKSFCLKKDPFFYAVYSKKLNQYCGMVSYLRITVEHGTIEVGHINYSPILQNTVEGTEAMYLMMQNAFENLGNRRYEWKCNNLNNSSKKAAKRLGFKFEGIFRQMFVFKKRNRDSAWFSIIDKEWKKVKKGYLKFLSPSNFDEQRKQKKKLKF